MTTNDYFDPNYIGNEESDMTIFAKNFTFETEMVVFKDLRSHKEINIIDKIEELENRINNLFNYMLKISENSCESPAPICNKF